MANKRYIYLLKQTINVKKFNCVIFCPRQKIPFIPQIQIFNIFSVIFSWIYIMYFLSMHGATVYRPTWLSYFQCKNVHCAFKVVRLTLKLIDHIFKCLKMKYCRSSIKPLGVGGGGLFISSPVVKAPRTSPHDFFTVVID